MEVKNMLVPNQTQMDEFLEGDIDSPISMVNLLKFKDKAEYEDGRKTDLTGKQAYSIYAIEVVNHLNKVGAEIIFGGEVSRLMLGEVEDLWDSIAIARYPSRKAMLQMMMDKDYQESAKHRSAGLEGQLNIETIEKAIVKKYLLICDNNFTVVFVILRYFSFNKNEYKVFKNAVSPTPTKLAGFALGEDVPFLAVNLLKFKEKAEYEDGRLKLLFLDKKAYSIYSDEVLNHLAKVGAKPIFRWRG